MNTTTAPSVDQLVAELKRSRYSRRYKSVMRVTLFVLVLIAFTAIAASFWFLSVMQVDGSSMAPTLQNGEILVALKNSEANKGDLAAFYFNDKLLIKRVIAKSGDQVSILPNGTVSVNGAALSEPYVASRALGECDITFPYTVPENRVFVLGDDRNISLDSRHSAIGCVATEQIIGRVVLRIWPLDRITLFESIQ